MPIKEDERSILDLIYGTEGEPKAPEPDKAASVSIATGTLVVRTVSPGRLLVSGRVNDSVDLPEWGEYSRVVSAGDYAVELRYSDGKREQHRVRVGRAEVATVDFSHEVAVVPVTPAVLSSTTIYKIGDKGPAGGWVFYDKGEVSDGWRYIECAPEDLTSTYKCGGYGFDCRTNTAIGSGKANTKELVKHNHSKPEYGSGLHDAARVAVNYSYGGKSDWFLPSKDELNLMYTNLKVKGLGGFKTGNWYWSSSQYCSGGAWNQIFSNGLQIYCNKYNKYYVRCVRAF